MENELQLQTIFFFVLSLRDFLQFTKLLSNIAYHTTSQVYYRFTILQTKNINQPIISLVILYKPIKPDDQLNDKSKTKNITSLEFRLPSTEASPFKIYEQNRDRILDFLATHKKLKYQPTYPVQNDLMNFFFITLTLSR